jgi:hypothetical protein
VTAGVKTFLVRTTLPPSCFSSCAGWLSSVSLGRAPRDRRNLRKQCFHWEGRKHHLLDGRSHRRENHFQDPIPLLMGSSLRPPLVATSSLLQAVRTVITRLRNVEQKSTSLLMLKRIVKRNSALANGTKVEEEECQAYLDTRKVNSSTTFAPSGSGKIAKKCCGRTPLTELLPWLSVLLSLAEAVRARPLRYNSSPTQQDGLYFRGISGVPLSRGKFFGPLVPTQTFNLSVS